MAIRFWHRVANGFGGCVAKKMFGVDRKESIFWGGVSKVLENGKCFFYTKHEMTSHQSKIIPCLIW